MNRGELRIWLETIEGVRALLNALDHELKTDTGMSHDDYEVLSRLHQAAGRTMRMSDLASKTGHSPSRLSHAIARLERDGLVERSPSEVDGRGVQATLTDVGTKLVQQASVGHFDLVRELIFDTLGPADARRLGRAMAEIRRAAEG
jgi:DNA-binding MarR family transcriptional regulator